MTDTDKTIARLHRAAAEHLGVLVRHREAVEAQVAAHLATYTHRAPPEPVDPSKETAP